VPASPVLPQGSPLGAAVCAGSDGDRAVSRLPRGTAGNDTAHRRSGGKAVSASAGAFAVAAARPLAAEETAERSSMGHGWPALDPAVGPASRGSERPDVTLHGDRLFCACEVQELPSAIEQAYASPAPAEVPHA
jgi:hypothetical protein